MDHLPKQQTTLPQHSEESHNVTYSLMNSTMLPANAIKILEVLSVATPHMSDKFDRRVSNNPNGSPGETSMLVLNAYLNVSEMEEPNGVHSVCNRGFKFPDGGQMFTVGYLQLPGLENLSAMSPDSRPTEKLRYEYLVVRVAVGHSWPRDDEQIERSKEIPSGYDSIYVKRVENSAPSECKAVEIAGSQNYQHRYIIQDPNQALAVYVVRFEVDPTLIHEAETPMCDQCDERKATVRCVEDKAYFCQQCDEQMHSSNKFLARHRRVSIAEQASSDFGMCPHHPNQSVEYFCNLCQEPVCVHCKMIGHHSAGERAVHRLTPLNVAYESALTASGRPDPHIQERKDTILRMLRQVDQQKKAICNNISTVEEQIYSYLQQVLYNLNDIRESKMGLLEGDAVELHRQLQYIDWIENFFKRHQQRLPAVDFLNCWARHTKLRNDICATKPRQLKSGPQVQPNVRLEGAIEVVQSANASGLPPHMSGMSNPGTPQHSAMNASFSGGADDDHITLASPATTNLRASLLSAHSFSSRGTTAVTDDMELPQTGASDESATASAQSGRQRIANFTANKLARKAADEANARRQPKVNRENDSPNVTAN